MTERKSLTTILGKATRDATAFIVGAYPIYSGVSALMNNVSFVDKLTDPRIVITSLSLGVGAFIGSVLYDIERNYKLKSGDK